MKNYQLIIKQTKNMIREWLESLNAPLFVFENLNSAKTHEEFNKIASIVIKNIKDINLKENVIIKFKKIQLIK